MASSRCSAVQQTQALRSFWLPLTQLSCICHPKSCCSCVVSVVAWFQLHLLWLPVVASLWLPVVDVSVFFFAFCRASSLSCDPQRAQWEHLAQWGRHREKSRNWEQPLVLGRKKRNIGTSNPLVVASDTLFDVNSKSLHQGLLRWWFCPGRPCQPWWWRRTRLL